MGKLNRGFNQTALNGSVGAVTYVTRKGITVAKQKVPAKLSYRRTIKSMTPRMRWMSIVRIWQALNTVGWRPSFLNKTGLQSDFNMFVKANSGWKLYLTREIVNANGGVVCPVQLTNGGLPSVGGTFSDGQFVTNISLGGTTIGASTTIETLSQAIIENNQGWGDGDQLTIVILGQLTDINGTPRLAPQVYQIYLDTSDESTLLGDILPANTLAVVGGKLAFGGQITGGAAVVHSSGDGDDFDVSTEFLAVSSTDLFNPYQGDAALLAAIDTYGGLSRAQFLIPEPSDNAPQGV